MESHFIGLFNSEEEILWENTSKILSDHDYWLYIADEHALNYVKTALKIADYAVQNGEIVSSADFYLREQVVRAKPVIEALEQKVNAIVNTGNLNLVIFCEMTWAVRTPSGDIYLRELQEAFQKYLLTNHISIVCIYNESILLDEQLMLGLFSHPEIYTENEIKPNPYFLPANIIKKNHLKPRFNYWLSKIDSQRKKSVVQLSSEENEEKKNYPIEKKISTKIAQTNEGRWKIRCLGELRIHRENGELIDWTTKAGATKKLKTIFAFLLIRGEKGASGEELADLLWQDADTTEQAMNRLYHAIRYLRMVLNGNQDSSLISSFITLQGSIYYLRLPFDSWIDLPMFQELCFKGNEHIKENNIEQAKICYESAERLYSGDLFNDIPLKYIENNENDWCWGKRFWYREMYHKLLYSLASIHRQLGNLSVAITYCDKALSEDPSLEAAHKEKLITLAEAQRFDAIHRQYRIYTESLKKFNLGLPSAEIRELYLNILRKN
jgi:two-component SAPR family response regulator